MIQVEAVSRNHTLNSLSDRVTGNIEARDEEGRGTRVRQKGLCFRVHGSAKRERVEERRMTFVTSFAFLISISCSLHAKPWLLDD